MWRRFGIAALAAALSALASPAAAIICPYGCYVQSAFYVDYTVPDDGLTYRWDVYTDSTDPSITVRLAHPNETFTTEQIANGDGTFQNVMTEFFAPYSWQELSVEPNHSSYLVSAPAGFNDCNPSTPAGQLCGVTYNVWGNGDPLLITASNAVMNGPLVHISFAVSLVPEPESWALIILGFGAAGAMLRRMRRARTVMG
jgi:PEP-CTERM motif